MPVPRFYKKKQYLSKKPETNTNEYISATYLIIVESPSKCKKIEEYLGSQYKCIASKGHLREIDGLKSINTKGNFEIKYSIIKEKQFHIENMRKIIALFSESNVYLATDDDREGEAISWHICDIFGLSTEHTPRILFHEITKPAIIHSIENPTKVNMKLVNAQKARQVLDMIVGYKISPLLWKHIYMSKDASLSAGRCQTPALRLVYDNDKEKDASGGMETKYKTTATFFNKNLVFSLNHDFTTEDDMVDFLKKSKSHNYVLELQPPRNAVKSSPKPFNTSRLLQTSSNILHISPKQTMSYCQQLYQEGHITYMRTDSTKYSKEFLNKASSYITKKWKSEYLGDLSKLENNNSLNPHEAIRITHIEQSSISGSDNRLCSLYKLIWKNTVESCMCDAKFKNIDAHISSPIEKIHYVYTIEIPLFLGWKAVSSKSDTSEEESSKTIFQNSNNGELLYLEALSKGGSRIKYNEINSIISIQNRHSHFTEASLIQKMEDLGIGRPSTFSMLVETIQDRGYVKRMDIEGISIKCIEYNLIDNVLKKVEKEKVFGAEKNKLVLQSTGILTLEFLITHFENLFSYNYTKEMEDKLDIISCSQNEEIEWYDICKNCNDEIKTAMKPVAKLEKQVYPINDEYVLTFQQFGPTLRKTTETGSFEYKSVKKDIQLDMEKLKNGKYTFDELIEIKNNVLGKYKEHDVYLKSGKYGPYIEWDTYKESIKTLKKPLSDVLLEDIMPYILTKTGEYSAPSGDGSGGEKDPNIRVLPPNKSILRILNSETSIRKGKFGAYIFYQTADMKKPEFFSLTKFGKGFATCDISELLIWIKEKYNVPK